MVLALKEFLTLFLDDDLEDFLLGKPHVRASLSELVKELLRNEFADMSVSLL